MRFTQTLLVLAVSTALAVATGCGGSKTDSPSAPAPTPDAPAAQTDESTEAAPATPESTAETPSDATEKTESNDPAPVSEAEPAAPADEDEIAFDEAEPETPLDETVFDVPDGEASAFYKGRLDDIQRYVGGLMENVQSEEEARAVLDPIEPKIKAALQTIFRNLASASDLATVERAQMLTGFVGSLEAEQAAEFDEAIAAIDAIVAKETASETPNSEFVDAAKALVAYQRVLKANAPDAGEVDVAALVAETKGLLDAQSDAGLPFLGEALDGIARLDAELALQTRRELIETLKTSDKSERKALADELEASLRSAIGTDMRVEGLFLDGTEIDWASYRGKVVLIDFWATWCGPCRREIPNVKAMYEKYHNAGFEVVGYSVDDDLDALKSFEEEEKLPWKTASSKMSVDAEKEFVDLSEYYNVTGIPTMYLIDKDGKILDTNARGEHLQELLAKQFPDVADAPEAPAQDVAPVEAPAAPEAPAQEAAPVEAPAAPEAPATEAAPVEAPAAPEAPIAE